VNTNKDKLIKMAVMGEIVPPSLSRNYTVDFNGEPRVGIGMYGVKYNVTIGDSVYGWEDGEHLEPGLSIRNSESSQAAALDVLACIGNEVTVKTGDAKGAKGYIIGKHVSFLIWLKEEAQNRVGIGDKIQIKSWGVGLKIDHFEETVRVNKIDPELLEKMSVKEENGKLAVPVVCELPSYIMGSGAGMTPNVDYDIQTTVSDEVIDEMGLKKLHFGDVVALKDQLNWWGRGYYKDAVTIGIVIHGWSYHAGHGPGVIPIMSAKSGVIVPKIDPGANIGYGLGIMKK
jgi:hypothetical protein